MRNTIPFLLIISFIPFLFLNSCRKDHKSDTPTPPVAHSPGNFVATIDGKSWAPSFYQADYLFRWHQLYIEAYDSTYHFTIGVNIDSNFVKQYLLQSNGDNEASLIEKNVATYYSGHDVLDAGGSFELTKFDTAKSLISGNLHFVGYSSDKSKRIEFSTEITDIPYRFHLDMYNGNAATCTVIGTKTTQWHSKDIFTRITCQVDNLKRSLEVQVSTDLDLYFYETRDRYIDFRIPLEKGTGLSQVYPQLTPYNDCGNRIVTSYYNLENYYYYPTAGSLNITYLDTAQKMLKAEFNITYRDTVKNNIIQITNGQINLNTWTNNF